VALITPGLFQRVLAIFSQSAQPMSETISFPTAFVMASHLRLTNLAPSLFFLSLYRCVRYTFYRLLVSIGRVEVRVWRFKRPTDKLEREKRGSAADWPSQLGILC
jgi:hypothetical protein